MSQVAEHLFDPCQPTKHQACNTPFTLPCDSSGLVQFRGVAIFDFSYKIQKSSLIEIGTCLVANTEIIDSTSLIGAFVFSGLSGMDFA